MVLVEDLQVEVTYKVGLGNLEMPKKVYEQIVEAFKNGESIEMEGMPKYLEAADWISQKIKESDCFRWEAEIENVD